MLGSCQCQGLLDSSNSLKQQAARYAHWRSWLVFCCYSELQQIIKVSDEHGRWNYVSENMGEAEKGIHSSVENFSVYCRACLWYHSLRFKVTLFWNSL